MKMRRRSFVAGVLAGLPFSSSLFAGENGASPAFAETARAAIARGTDWLKKNQRDDGSWSEASTPALTGLALWALADSGRQDCAENISRAIAFLLKCQNPDGGIYRAGTRGGGLSNYNTSVCMAALYATGRKDVIPAVLRARSFLAASQHKGDDAHTGGFGYDAAAQRLYTDLNNTTFALDAMRRTQGAEEFRPSGVARADVDWDAALKYVSSLQVGEGPTAGGFTYNLTSAKAGVDTNANGKVIFRAYGSMTYAGVLSMIHAKLDRKDIRVRNALAFASSHWTVDENPGQGQQGVFFYLDIMSRALRAADIEILSSPESKIRWKEEVVRKLAASQQAEGFWSNENNRWWENNPVLASSYALIALESIIR